ncbi:hypothetical protein GGS24DRAFT_493616 [Hypoxylon argillaceum]|nr:hypothetical protein GGS24DRAFT_493616 [Hypoxylon argillaceum]
MAHSFESGVNITAPAPESSPSDILDDTKIQRSLFKISSTQKKLLNRNESWASFLSRRPAGFVNVPPQVLDQLRASHARQKQATAVPKATASPGRAGDNADPPEPSGSQSSSLPRGEHGDEDDDDPSDIISWASSPERNLRPPSIISQEPVHPFITQLPQASSLEPPIVTSPALPEHSKPVEFPPSSQGPEDELEVQVPGALAYNPEPINKSGLPMLATPPSAQIVPCTFEQSVQSTSAAASTKLDPQLKPQSKKHVYKPVPQLYRGPKQSAASHLNINVGPAKTVATTGQNNDKESSLSAGNTSPSIIPSTIHDQNTHAVKHIPAWDARPGQLPMHDANSSFKDSRSSLASRHHSPMDMPISPSRVLRSPQQPISLTRPAVALSSWEAPFIHYTVTYPSYNGTIQDFVTACIYIQLQYRRIRTSLYDDFIRAWVEGYLPYVKDCDESQPPQKPLRAIEWYNEIDDDPLFTSRVVTRQNLQSILNFYPNELKAARLSFGIVSGQGSSEYSVSESHAEPHSRQNRSMSSKFPTNAQSWKEKELIRQPGERAGLETRLPPTPTPISFTANQYIPAHQSFHGTETPPVNYKGLARSFSESTTDRKRTAANQLRPEAAKRVSLGPALGTHSRMWSDSGSGGSNYSERSKSAARSSDTPEPTARQKSGKSTEDPEERRRRRLAKHFKKTMAGRESISSSIPIRHSPVSGKK